MDVSYIINFLGEDEFDQGNAISPPIYQTSNFYFKTVEEFRIALMDERTSLVYSRGNNPTINLLCKKLAALEHTEEALVFASGMAAISAAILAMVRSGDHVVCVQSPYSWTDTLMNTNIFPKFGIEVTMVDAVDPLSISLAIKPNTRLIYLESPNSWTFEIQDLKEIANIAKGKGIVTIIDNSYSTPLYQNPATLGIDLIVHTISKYIGGHSDVVAGACCGSKILIDKIFHNEFLTFGGILSPFNAWLVLRGLRTLPLRMERISASTAKILDFIRHLPCIKKIYYPLLETNPQYGLAKSQMIKGSGLFTIELKTEDIAAIEDFCNSLTYWRMAVSWGGHESLIIPSCTFVKPGLYSRLPANLIRFSVGLEDPESIIKDLENNIWRLSRRPEGPSRT